MQFKTYLVEKNDLQWDDINVEKLKTTLNKSCKPFIDEMKNTTKELIYRGYRKGIGNRLLARKPVQKDRNPRYISDEMHKTLGDYMKKKYGWNPRTEGVFTADRSLSLRFGDFNTFLFFPVGKYKYIWTEREHLNNIYGYYDIDNIGDLLYYLDTKDPYKENNIKNHSASFEAIFKCESFYLIKPILNSYDITYKDNKYDSIEDIIFNEIL